MIAHEQIRMMREIRHWSQEDMAEKLNMSVSGYAKIERGESKLSLDKLQKIADVFGMDVSQLMQHFEKGVLFLMSDNGDNASYNAVYYGQQDSAVELEKLKLTIAHQSELLKHKDDIISQKEREINTLQSMLEFLKKQ